MSLDDRIKLAEAAIDDTTIDYSEWIKRVSMGYKGKPYAYETTAWHRTFMAAAPTKNAWLELLDAAKTDEPVPPLPGPEPEPEPPAPLWTDGFENRNLANWVGGASGRLASCDCTRVCPGGTPDTSDPLDSFTGTGWRVGLRPECKSLKASCLNACELVKTWPEYGLGQTTYRGHSFTIVPPYTPQVGWSLVSQLNYCQVKYNTLGLQLVGNDLSLHCSLGYSEKGSTAYNNPGGYSPRGGTHPASVGQRHEYVWGVTAATEYGTGGMLKLWHKLAGSSAWALLFDSTASHPAGVPTRQWGYGLGNDTVHMVDVQGRKVTTGAPQPTHDKIGAYRANGNENILTIEHHRLCVAESFASAAAYASS